MKVAVRTVAVVVARLLPQPIKRLINHNRTSYRLSRQLFSKMIGSGVVTIESGPCGLRLVCSPHVSHALAHAAFGSAINETETRWPVLKLKTTTLDLFAAHHPAPDFIKVDVEGEEGRVLEGARGLLATKRPIICCELHSAETAAHVLSILREYRYSVQDLAGRRFVAPREIVAGELQVLCVPEGVNE